MNWIELHTNTCCSDTLSFLEPEQVISFAASSGCKAVAITDRNSVRAYWAAEQEAARKNIFLIYGLTIDCVDEEDRYAVTVLAKNEQGRRKLFSLIHLLDQNHFPFGRCVTRAQLDSHREGLLLGASAANGQLIRAIQLRYGERRLYQIAKAYDYIELPLLPYDAAAQLFPIAKVCQIPLCAVQHATIREDHSSEESHTFRAVALSLGREDLPQPYRTPAEFYEQMRQLYSLPGEKDGIEDALTHGPVQILNQIESIPPLHELLRETTGQLGSYQQERLRIEAEDVLIQKYGTAPAAGIRDRFNWELERIEALHMASQILFMRDIAQIVLDTGSSMTIGGTWNSSFLLYLLGVTETDPLSADPDTKGSDLCPVSLLGTGKPLLSADIRVSPELIPILEKSCAHRYGRRLLEVNAMSRMSSSEEHTTAVIRRYFEELGQDSDVEFLQQNGLFYHTVSRHSSRMSQTPSLHWLYLLPKEVDPTFLPVTTDPITSITQLDTSRSIRFDHIPCVLLIGSSANSVLDMCVQKTGIPYQNIPLDDEAVFSALRKAYVEEDPEGSVAAACKLVGSGICTSNTEIFRAMNVQNLHSLSRFMSLSHSSAAWQENQQLLLENGTLTPDMLITCREDIYRYMMEHGASTTEATAVMDSVQMGLPSRFGYSASDELTLALCQVDPWFTQVCQKIEYLFPEAHSLSFAIQLVRLVWYVIYRPEVGSLLIEECI